MPRFDVTLSDRFTPRLAQAYRDMLPEVQKAVHRGGLRLESATKTWIRQNGPYDRGRLRQSIHTVDERRGDSVSATVAANVKYAEAAHEGQKSGHFPPVSVLQAWVRRRVRQGRMALTGRGTQKQQIRSAAYLIGRKIEREGTEGVPFFDRVYDENHRQESERVERDIVRLIGRELRNG